jgi:hypothetical protein
MADSNEKTMSMADIEAEIQATLKPGFAPVSTASRRPRISLASETTISTEPPQTQPPAGPPGGLPGGPPPEPAQEPKTEPKPAQEGQEGQEPATEPKTVTDWLRRLDGELGVIYRKLDATQVEINAKLDAILATLR